LLLRTILKQNFGPRHGDGYIPFCVHDFFRKGYRGVGLYAVLIHPSRSSRSVRPSRRHTAISTAISSVTVIDTNNNIMTGNRGSPSMRCGSKFGGVSCLLPIIFLYRNLSYAALSLVFCNIITYYDRDSACNLSALQIGSIHLI